MTTTITRVVESSYFGVRMRAWGEMGVGTFATAEMAAQAHNITVVAIKGDAANLNFPELAWLLPRTASYSRRDVRVAAIKAARMDHLPNCEPTTPELASSSSSEQTETTAEPSKDKQGEIVELPADTSYDVVFPDWNG